MNKSLVLDFNSFLKTNLKKNVNESITLSSNNTILSDSFLRDLIVKGTKDTFGNSKSMAIHCTIDGTTTFKKWVGEGNDPDEWIDIMLEHFKAYREWMQKWGLFNQRNIVGYFIIEKMKKFDINDIIWTYYTEDDVIELTELPEFQRAYDKGSLFRIDAKIDLSAIDWYLTFWDTKWTEHEYPLRIKEGYLGNEPISLYNIQQIYNANSEF